MTQDFQPESIQPEITSTPPGAVHEPVQPRKSNRFIWLILALVIFVGCLCSILCLGVVGFSLYKANQEKQPVESILDSYMRAMDQKDALSAYELFSPRAQRQFPISKLKTLLEGNNYLLFEGYRKITVAQINISTVANTDPDVPQGTVAKVSGAIRYSDGVEGTFSAVLEKVNGKWMLDGINVTVPPSKFK